MLIAKLSRIYQADCTIGIFNYSNFRCCALELPWLDNQQDISCIPAGRYLCKKITSPSHGACLEITNVLNRTHIQIHAGNFTRDILGCIAVGSYIKDIDSDGTLDVANSVATLKKLLAAVPDAFELVIA